MSDGLTALPDLVRLRPRDEYLYVSRGRSALITARDGFVHGAPEQGLFVHHTRLASRYRYLIDGHPPVPAGLSNVEQHSWLGYYIASPRQHRKRAGHYTLGPGGLLTQQTLELRLCRFVGEGMHEDIDLTNYSVEPLVCRLELQVDADFAGLDESRHGRIGFSIELRPHETWRACISAVAYVENEPLPVEFHCRSFSTAAGEYGRRARAFLSGSTRCATPESNTLSQVVLAAFERARHDLVALRLFDLDRNDDQDWVAAAGLPIYQSLFGRDSLTAAWQAALLGPELMRGTLPAMVDLQGTTDNPWRDEQPGKMHHEANTGPTATLGFSPLDRYYGSLTTSGFFPVVVSELWHWTADKERARRFVEPALAALGWLDAHGDLDGDGFYEYKTRSRVGLIHQAWKDSADAIVHSDGRQVAPPVATCEEQAFVYVAKLHLSEVLWWLDRKDESQRLLAEARELKKRFNAIFWQPEIGFLAMGLDAKKRPILSVGSNALHCLAAGIVDEEFVRPIADRLLAPDMFSGWGIRTLTSAHPSYNPYSYHRGSVWPVEHGACAIGFLRYGLHGDLERLCRAQFEVAALYDAYRLPELFAGHERNDTQPFPAVYAAANAPQAWSASAVCQFVQALTGIYPYAPLNLLLVDPHLPAWLPNLTVERLRVGDARVTLRFHRNAAGHTGYEVVEKDGSLHVLRQPSPWSLTATSGERIIDALASLAPGH